MHVKCVTELVHKHTYTVYIICKSLHTALGWETAEFVSDKYGDDAKNGELISVIKET
jgi:hypothetical protein